MRFTKMHGLGNDYVYVNCFEQTVNDPQTLAPQISDRHFGIGSDGLILVMPSDIADAKMRMFNADGSESQMCGNGVRCVAKLVYDNNLAQTRPIDHPICQRLLQDACPDADSLAQLNIETGNGVLTIALAITSGQATHACVDMGNPILAPLQIPVNIPGPDAGAIPIAVNGYNFIGTCVSMGNPHVTIYVEDVSVIDLPTLGPLLEKHELFPLRVNVHFVQIIDDKEVIMRTWERGSGITLACGTGASAVCVAGVLTGNSQRQILAHLPGGDLQLLWAQEDNHVYMVGPAANVFTGTYPA